jgi:hypothetical protein
VARKRFTQAGIATRICASNDFREKSIIQGEKYMCKMKGEQGFVHLDFAITDFLKKVNA